jgi:dolichol-phosphate mannosyltransferase
MPEERPVTDRIAGPELSVIVPTFNEYQNVDELIARIGDALGPSGWEVIFVDDDSPDGTARLVRDISRRDGRVRCVQRVGRRGLSSACIEGMLASSAPYLAVIDGDLQHDEALLPRMLEIMRRGDTDVVVGTRYSGDGGVGNWDESRVAISAFASRLSRFVLKSNLSDPMSGFFMLRRDWMETALRRLSGIGFKILVDLFASAPRPPRFAELPYQFRTRKLGESKLDTVAVWDYLMLLLDKTVGHLVPVRFVSFGIVGSIGVVVHFAVLATLFNLFDLGFDVSQAAATLTAMTGNFALNNMLTYRDMRLTGWRWLKGWASFLVACSVGALANVGVASYLFERDTRWVFAGLAGILVGMVWNYVVTMLYTWKPRQRPA